MAMPTLVENPGRILSQDPCMFLCRVLQMILQDRTKIFRILAGSYFYRILQRILNDPAGSHEDFDSKHTMNIAGSVRDSCKILTKGYINKEFLPWCMTEHNNNNIIIIIYSCLYRKPQTTSGHHWGHSHQWPFPASNPPAHTFPPFTHNPCYRRTPKTCTTMIQCKPRSPKATQIYLRSSNSRDKGELNKNNAALKKPVCQADCVCCAVRYVFNLSLKSSSVCTLLISYGISFHNLLPEYDMVLLKSCVLPLGINKLLLVTDLVL